ncbi:pancreatic triacylglycerol lipase-like, partial [Argonauta hians]
SSACYGKLGCFSTDGFFSIWRPINLLPESRETINTQFRLFTRQNPKVDTLIRADYPLTLSVSHFNGSKPTKFLVHGFTQDGFIPWIVKMKDELLKYDDFNVFIVDWGSGSKPPYTQATGNTRLVGAEIAYLIKYLEQTAQLSRSHTHIIGHSLGSHIAGYAGAALPGLSRITGLDPAGPYFEGTPEKVRLDPSDANFVDNIHSDARNIVRLGFGMLQACGHVDYYPNGGNHQPGCDKDPFTFLVTHGLEGGLTKFVACDHMRAVHFFTESINSKCGFPSFKCDFQARKCSPEAGSHMGLHADHYKPPKGKTGVKLYLETADEAPFCLMHYKVNVRIGASVYRGNIAKGNIYAQLVGKDAQSEMEKLTDNNIDLDPKKTLSFLLKNKKNLGEIVAVKLKWKYEKEWLKPWTWITGQPKILMIFRLDVMNDMGESKKLCHTLYSNIKHDTVVGFKLKTSC